MRRVGGRDRTEGELKMEGQGIGEDPRASEGAEDVSRNREDGERQTGLGLRGKEEWLERWSRIWAGLSQRDSGGGGDGEDPQDEWVRQRPKNTGVGGCVENGRREDGRGRVRGAAVGGDEGGGDEGGGGGAAEDESSA